MGVDAVGGSRGLSYVLHFEGVFHVYSENVHLLTRLL